VSLWIRLLSCVNESAKRTKASLTGIAQPVDEHSSSLAKSACSGSRFGRIFERENTKEREGKRSEYTSAVLSGEADRYRNWLEGLRHGSRPSCRSTGRSSSRRCSHVRTRVRCNHRKPSVCGKNTIAAGNPPGYLDWLKVVHEETHGMPILSHTSSGEHLLSFARKDLRAYSDEHDWAGRYPCLGLRGFVPTEGRSSPLVVALSGLARCVVVSVVNVFKGSMPDRSILMGDLCRSSRRIYSTRRTL